MSVYLYFMIYNGMTGKSEGVQYPFILRNAYNQGHLDVRESTDILDCIFSALACEQAM